MHVDICISPKLPKLLLQTIEMNRHFWGMAHLFLKQTPQIGQINSTLK